MAKSQCSPAAATFAPAHGWHRARPDMTDRAATNSPEPVCYSLGAVLSAPGPDAPPARQGE